MIERRKDKKLQARRGRAQAVVKPIEEIQLEDIEDREDLKAARAALRDVKRHGTIPWEQVKKDLGLI